MDFIDYDYEEIRDDVFELFGNMLDTMTASEAEKEFFSCDTEAVPDTFLSTLATAVYEIKKNCLTDALKTRTKLLIQEFKDGAYDGFILDSDLPDVKRDIKFFEKNI